MEDLNSQCQGCLYAKMPEAALCCTNRNRVNILLAKAKEHMENGRFFTASRLLEDVGNMDLDFKKTGMTKCSDSRSPTCYTFLSSDEDFNMEMNKL